MDPSSSQQTRVPWLAAGVGLALVLAPVLLSPVLPTQDGPSHLYNAFLAHRLAAGDPLFTPYLELGPGLWPNRFTHYLLTSLGPLAGWTLAERVTAVIATVFPFLAVIWWTREAADRTGLLVLGAALWMAGSWFFWKGFYDFCVSLAPFLGVAVVLGRMNGGAGGDPPAGPDSSAEPDSSGGAAVSDDPATPGWRIHLAFQGMIALVLLSHLFTFAVALALAAFVLVGRTLQGRLSPTHLLTLLPGAAVLAGLLASGTLGGGDLAWYTWGSALEAAGSAAWATIRGLRSLPGIAIVVVFAAAPFLRWALSSDEKGKRRDLRLFEIFALLALVGSLVTPAKVGTGQYAPERIRLLGLLLLAPSAALVAVELAGRRATAWIAPAAGVLLAVAFALRGLDVLRQSRAVDQDLRSMDRALRQYDPAPGDWITATFFNPFGASPRVAPWIHLHDRLAIRHELVVLDNYEARMPIFPVRWKETPHRPEFVRIERGGELMWLVEITRGDQPWPDPLLVLHESDYPLMTREPELDAGRAAPAAGFTVTELLWGTAPGGAGGGPSP